MPSSETIANIILHDLDLIFPGEPFQVAISTNKRWKNSNITIVNRKEVRYLPSNEATANVVCHALDLYF